MNVVFSKWCCDNLVIISKKEKLEPYSTAYKRIALSGWEIQKARTCFKTNGNMSKCIGSSEKGAHGGQISEK